MSLYRKDELLSAIVAGVLERLELDLPKRGSWTDEAAAWMHALRNQLRGSPAVVAILMQHGHYTPALLRVTNVRHPSEGDFAPNVGYAASMTTRGVNQHAGPAAAPSSAPPEPTFAEQARTLIHLGRVGALSTHSRKAQGFPFGSVAPYGLDDAGRPTFLISTMAMHTQNLVADGRASLLVTQPGWTEDPLAGARVTLAGRVAPLPAADLAPVREEYLGRHENARHWVDFDDFSFYRMEVVDLYYVAGFGAMGWVDTAEYRAAAPDPLADSAPGILAHMNADHREALKLYCRVFAGVEVDDATMTAVDRLGFRVRAQIGERLQGLRINFLREARSPEAARAVLVEMVRQARGEVTSNQ